jgi:hypothetical protein
MARIHDDQLQAALERLDGGGGVREACVGGVVSPEDQAATVGNVRHCPATAAGRHACDAIRVARRKAPSPPAHVQCPDKVRRSEGIYEPANEGRRISDGGGGRRGLAEGDALRSVGYPQPAQCRSRSVQGLLPGNLNPARIGISLRPGAAQWPGQTLAAVNQLRRGTALRAQSLAGRVRWVRIETREAAVLHGGDAAAAGDAQPAVAGNFPRSRRAHDGSFLRRLPHSRVARSVRSDVRGPSAAASSLPLRHRVQIAKGRLSLLIPRSALQ